MKQGLSYGRITLSYQEDDVRPSPVVSFGSIRFRGQNYKPKISDRDALFILKMKSSRKIPFRDAYVESVCRSSRAQEVGEGRALIQWLKKHGLAICWNKNDFILHPLFNGKVLSEDDEFASEHSFSIMPVTVMGRTIKLYIEDEAMLSLIHLPFGEEEEFMSLVKRYIARRFQWDHWQAPAPPFADWVRHEGKRPVFSAGQIGFKPCSGVS